jgi:hypothetical protein
LGDIDIDTLAEATRRYADLRRLYRRLFYGGLPLVAMFLAYLFAFGTRGDSPGKDIFDCLVFLAVPAYLGVVRLMWHWLVLFTCPRCGEPLGVPPDDRSAPSTCNHCGQRME